MAKVMNSSLATLLRVYKVFKENPEGMKIGYERGWNNDYPSLRLATQISTKQLEPIVNALLFMEVIEEFDYREERNLPRTKLFRLKQ